LAPHSLIKKELITSKILSLPAWVEALIPKIQAKQFPTDEDKMRQAIELARLNVLHETGGPFGAVIFNLRTNRIVGLGVNRVVPEHASIAHAEMMAITMAQEKIKSSDLGAMGMDDYVLITSAQPCIMCYGGILWSGVKKVVCGATRQDVEGILGFDEGPLPENWRKEANERGIQIIQNVCQDTACEVLHLYVAKNGIVYKSRGGR
jgi:tRNA(Arg) A34 adenosine deaminase TadA